MPENKNFKITDPSVEIMFPSSGVLITSGTFEQQEAIVGAYYDNSELGKGTYVLSIDTGIKYFDLNKSQVASSGEFATKLVFQDDQNAYLIRKIVPDDGSWLSDYGVAVPLQVLESKVSVKSRGLLEDQLGLTDNSLGFLPFFETMVFYYRDEIDPIIDVLYMTSAGSYSRQNAGWTEVDISSSKYEDVLVAEIQPTKAKDFLKEYDSSLSIDVKRALSYTSPQ